MRLKELHAGRIRISAISGSNFIFRVIFNKMESIRRIIGQNIRALRLSQGYKIGEFALKAKLKPTYVGSVERGERNITVENLQKIANTLGVPTYLLLTEGLSSWLKRPGHRI
jgi:ribosome-binding protein aMBF1 (putative translation factor)